VRAADRLNLVILAAGAGRRLGCDKATLPWGSTVLVRHVFDQFPAERVARCVVVTNPRNQVDVRQALPERAEVAVNPDARAEMITSVRLGIEALGASDGPLCIHPVDVFAVSPDLVLMLHEEWLEEPERIHLPEVAGKGAHPLIVPARLVEAIRTLPAGCGLNRLLQGQAADVVRHPWHDERLVEDIDTPDVYARYRP
jgi:molybdenum cofactor cytidylyltransferase